MFLTVLLEKNCESPWTSRRSNQLIPRGNQLWIFTGRTDAEAEAPIFGHLMQTVNSLEKTLMLGKMEARRRNGQHRTRWVDGNTNSMLMSLSPLWKMVKDSEAWSGLVHGVADSWTRLISKTTTIATIRFFLAFLLPLLVKPLQLYIIENAVEKGKPLYFLHLYV